MKLLTPLSIGVLSLLLGAPAIVCAQDDAKPPKQEEPKPHPDQAKPQRGDEDKPKDVKPEKRDEMKPEATKPEDMKREEGRQEEKRNDAKPQEHPENARENGRPAGKHVDRIPDDRFRQNFGREHVTIINRPVIVEGRPSFQFGGYWFGISTGWPVDWAYTDQVYVDYIDGEYFLFDVLHPGVRVALIVTE